MKVYVVTEDYPYDGGEPVSVWTDKELAVEASRQVEEDNRGCISSVVELDLLP